MPIKLLDKATSELIAAGEVVERPASVVKELVENSLDAGARKIETELKSGGLALIRISDDGCGIAPDEVARAFLRHATSKISGAADLDSIATLGFRGEALAAIAAVSRVRLVTRPKGEDMGCEYIIEGGEEVSLEPCGAPEGSSIWVRDIFFNTPARMKFLKKDVYEGNAVQTIVEQLALSRPDVAFTLLREGRRVFSSPGDGSLFSAAYSVLPRETAEALLPLQGISERVAVGGFVGRPSAARASRSAQYIFVNGRCVKSRSISAAAEEAGRGLVMAGRRLAFIIDIRLPASEVDVNVHPAKTEVRFRNEREVSSAVYGAVKLALEEAEREFSPLAGAVKPQPQEAGEKTESWSAAQTPEAKEKTESGETPAASGLEVFSQRPAAGNREAGARRGESLLMVEFEASDEGEPQRGFLEFFPGSPENAKTPDALRQPAAVCAELREAGREYFAERGGESTESFTEQPLAPPEMREERLAGFEEGCAVRILGEVMGVFIVAEAAGELVLIDKHAAHERLLFEKLRAAHEGGVDRQILAEAQIIPLGLEEKQRLLDCSAQLERIGFLVEDFGERELALREIPAYLDTAAAVPAVGELAERLLSAAEPDTTAREWLLHSSACRAAIKAGHRTSNEEMAALVSDMLSSKIPLRCPHGRPVYISFGRNELEKRFGRIQ
ncbi:MAG: DNA mismatch repair endonuclease MutL [Oscillospiraceae bacterium]|nr:DNA mismatch repair endonuclease MutL [Oscillospiraceae bacterium]